MQFSLQPFSRLFHQQGLIHLAYKIITYIDIQTLMEVISQSSSQSENMEANQTEIIAKGTKTHPKIKHIIQSHCFMQEYLNKTDRSMYFPLYDQQQFLTISKQLYQNIVMTESLSFNQSFESNNKLSTHFMRMNHVFINIQKQQLLTEEQLEQLKRIIVDPSLPLPPLKRQNQGMYCNSSFQLFLVGLRFPHYNIHQQVFTPFEQLKHKIQSQQDSNFKQFLQIQKQKHSNTKIYQTIHIVRYMPYQITFQNYLTLSLDNNSLHNFIVTIFALTDIWIQSIFSIITNNNIINNDPYYKFVQLISRYAAFRSLVMQIEDSLGFVFRAYQNLYADTIRDSLFFQSDLKPKYCYWRPALTKWFVRMNAIHPQTNQVYFMLLTKMRQQALFQKLDDDNHDPAWKIVRKNVITLKNCFELNQFSTELKDKIDQNMTGSSLVEQFIIPNNDQQSQQSQQPQQQTCQSLIFQYIQYFIDLAINQQTVHWCGHSSHHLEQPCVQFKKQFLLYNDSFVNNLKDNILVEIKDGERKKMILQLFLQSDVQFLQRKNVKPVMLKQYVDEINVKRKFFENFMIQDGDGNQSMQKNLISTKTIPQQEPSPQQNNKQNDTIFVNFNQKDQTLKYFNKKAMICQSIEGEEKYFFSIPPLLSPQEILTKSINTNDTSENQECDNNSSFQYVSDNECQIGEVENITSILDNGEKDKDKEKPEEKILPTNNKAHKIKQTKKKVKFHSYNNNKYLQDIQLSEDISTNQKKTLDSTNSSTKNSQIINASEQNQKSHIQLQKEDTFITKSQSV